MSELVCFGELMLRLSAPQQLRLSQAGEFKVTFGGAEANVAVAVAQLGGSASFVTRLPQHELADRALAELRGLHVDVAKTVRGGHRMGTYFVEHGASLRSSKVIYDRAHSAMAEAESGHFDWANLLVGTRWLHWSGITPALSPKMATVCAQACEAAQAQGITVSFDLNFRSKLWTEAEAGRVLTPLMRFVNVCITSAEEARTIFGLPIPAAAPDRETVAAEALVNRFGFHTVALTSRRTALADETEWGAMLHTGGKFFYSRRHNVGIVDRLGAGDCFTGALLFALLRGDESQLALDLAVAASALKHTIYGDYARMTLGEVEAVRCGGAGGRVQR